MAHRNGVVRAGSLRKQGNAAAARHPLREIHMNWDQIKGNWKQVTGKIREKWGKLTDDDLDVIAGKRDQLLGKLQEKYGYEKERAEKELDEFLGLNKP